MLNLNLSKSICVYCASSDAISPDFFTVANELGAAIARADYTLIYGGGEIGLMGELARSVHSCDGRVVGVIPEFLRRPGISYESADELIVTCGMRERKAVMESRADAFIALPGGFGTLEEMLEIITLKQLGILNKPVVFLNTSGFYDGLNQVFEHIFNHNFAKPRYRELYHFAHDVTEAMEHIESYEAPVLGEKWL